MGAERTLAEREESRQSGGGRRFRFVRNGEDLVSVMLSFSPEYSQNYYYHQLNSRVYSRSQNKYQYMVFLSKYYSNIYILKKLFIKINSIIYIMILII